LVACDVRSDAANSAASGIKSGVPGKGGATPLISRVLAPRRAATRAKTKRRIGHEQGTTRAVVAVVDHVTPVLNLQDQESHDLIVNFVRLARCASWALRFASRLIVAFGMTNELLLF